MSHDWVLFEAGYLHALRGLEHERAHRVGVQVEVLPAGLAHGVVEGDVPVRGPVPFQSPAQYPTHRLLLVATVDASEPCLEITDSVRIIATGGDCAQHRGLLLQTI